MANQAYHTERPKPEDYAPYHTMPAFQRGIVEQRNPFDPNSVEAQAWDRGAEYRMRMERLGQ
jgi:hypothetical protein